MFILDCRVGTSCLLAMTIPVAMQQRPVFTGMTLKIRVTQQSLPQLETTSKMFSKNRHLAIFLVANNVSIGAEIKIDE